MQGFSSEQIYEIFIFSLNSMNSNELYVKIGLMTREIPINGEPRA